MRVIVISIKWKPEMGCLEQVAIVDAVNKFRKRHQTDFIGGVRFLVPINTPIPTIYSIYVTLGKLFPNQHVNVCIIPIHEDIIINGDSAMAVVSQEELFFQWPREIIKFWGRDLISVECPLRTSNQSHCDQNICLLNEDGFTLPSECYIKDRNSEIASSKQIFVFGGSFDGLHVGHLMALHTLLSLVSRGGQNTANSKLIAFGISEEQAVQSKSNGEIARSFETRLDSLDRAVCCLLKFSGFVIEHEEGGEIHNGKNVSHLAKCAQDIQAQYKTKMLRVWKNKSGKQIWVILTLLDSGGVGVAAYSEIEVLLVSPETMKGAKHVNRVRKELGYKELIVCVCPLVLKPSEENIAIVNGSVENKISSSDERQSLSMLLKKLESYKVEKGINPDGKWPLCYISAINGGLGSKRRTTFLRNVLLPIYCDKLCSTEKAGSDGAAVGSEESTNQGQKNPALFTNVTCRTSSSNTAKETVDDDALLAAWLQLTVEQQKRAVEYIASGGVRQSEIADKMSSN